MKPTNLNLSIAVTCLALAGCNQSAEKQAEHIENRVDQMADATEARIDNTVDRMGAALTPVPTPQEFTDRAAKSDAFEIEAAKLAATKASSAEVKAFAQDMIKAHTDSTAKIKTAAGAAKITPDAALTRDQQEDLADLGKLTGTKFDDEYMDAQVAAHEDALSLMRNFAADGADAGLKAVAGEIVPVVEKHLAMARSLDEKVDR
jgi:putative membrane protein